jgi:prepilin-type N-terminal cleavage/methylation domain-containing protein
MKKYFSRKRHGFTLIELLIVCVIIATLAVVALVSYNSARVKSRDAKRISDIESIQSALEVYYENNSLAYPVSTNCNSVTTQSPTSKWCNSVQTAGGGSQWVFNSDGKSLVNFLSPLPVDPIPLTADTIAASVFSGTTPKTGAYYYMSTTGQAYYIVFMLEDTSGTIIQQDGVVVDAIGTKTLPVDSAIKAADLCCDNGNAKLHFSTNATGIVTLGKNKASKETCATADVAGVTCPN